MTTSIDQVKLEITSVAHMLRTRLTMGQLFVIRHEDVKELVMKKFDDELDPDLVDDLIHEELHHVGHKTSYT